MSAVEVDARGLRCPLPVIRLAEAARYATTDTRITLLATDPAARHDVAAWCRMRDHELLEVTEISGATDAAARDTGQTPEAMVSAAGPDPSYLRFVVLVRGQPPNGAGAGSRSARSSRPT